FKRFGYKRKQIKEAVNYGFLKQKEYLDTMQKLGKKVFNTLKNEKKIGVVLLCRSYHLDPGINHQIPEEIQKRGYPILTIESLPLEEAPSLDIQDVWKMSYSENSNRKVWAAKYVAHYPFLAAVDLSSFKCGHDSPILRVVEEILHKSNTPYFAFHELDENKPAGSIKIRVETLDYFLKERERELKENSYDFNKETLAV
ncbi:MAG TPA: CoA activase, partial [Aquificae bacterium]|nr:CoA activase [Aquificota bacterium]